MFHNDVHFGALLIHKMVIVLDNILVGEVLQYVDFVNKLIFLLSAHGAIVNFLPDKDTAIWDSFDLLNGSKLAFADIFQFFELFHAIVKI